LTFSPAPEARSGAGPRRVDPPPPGEVPAAPSPRRAGRRGCRSTRPAGRPGPAASAGKFARPVEPHGSTVTAAADSLPPGPTPSTSRGKASALARFHEPDRWRVSPAGL